MWFARFSIDLATHWVRDQGGTVWVAEDGSEACAYVPTAPVPSTQSIPSMPPTLAAPALAQVGQLGQVGHVEQVAWVRLAPHLTLPGASQGADAPWHYIVATDVVAAQEDDFNAWYDTEHLPGLAAVPGVARAARYHCVQGEGPRYHAAYDLAERAAFNGPDWLAVRGTPWSSRVRPGFFNTRRTMYRRLA